MLYVLPSLRDNPITVTQKLGFNVSFCKQSATHIPFLIRYKTLQTLMFARQGSGTFLETSLSF